MPQGMGHYASYYWFQLVLLSCELWITFVPLNSHLLLYRDFDLQLTYVASDALITYELSEDIPTCQLLFVPSREN